MRRVLVGLVPIASACALLAGSAAVTSAPVLQAVPVAHVVNDATLAGGAGLRTVPPVPGVHAYTDTYTVQHPFNLPVSARFSVTPGPVYNAWVFKGDAPLRPGSGTGPRTEMRWALNWSRGLHIWEADVLIDAGTEKTAIMQVKSDNGGREAIYAQVNRGNLYNVSGGGGLVLSNAIGRWFHMACAYDPATGVSRIWVNGALVSTGHYPRPASTVWYFKNGVYYNGGGNPKSETHFKNIQFWMA